MSDFDATLTEALEFTAAFTPEAFPTLAQHLDPLWVEEALLATGTATIRRRRLPADRTVWLVLAMALLRDWPITEVARQLDLALPARDGSRTVASSALTQARNRLGSDPMEWLFLRTGEEWAGASADRDRWHGLSLFAVDGTTLRVADSVANRDHFGSHRAGRHERQGFQPQLLLTSLTDPTRFPAARLRLLYHQRWEIELGIGEIKTDMLDRLETIRSKSPTAVTQEIWGLLLAYNLVRLEMERIANELKVEPTRISFLAALRHFVEQWLWASQTQTPGAIPKRLSTMRDRLRRFLLPPRRPERWFPRAVKLKMSNYERKHPTTLSAQPLRPRNTPPHRP